MSKILSPQLPNGGVFDVVSYGADPTGSADCQAAFQAAADALVAFNSTDKPGKLVIPPGKYKLNSTFRIIGGNAVIEAYGAYIFSGSNNDLFRNYTSEDGTYTLNGRNLQILGGIWDCKGQDWGLSSNATLNAVGFSAITLANASDILLRDITVRNVYDFHGFDINTCNGITVDNCRFEGFQNNFTWHTDVRVASTANVTLASAVENGDTIDGVVLATGNRVLLKNQTSSIENGIYTVNASGAPTRATDMDAAGEADRAAVEVTAGTVNVGTSWYQSAVNPTPGTNAMTWAATTGFNVDSRYFSEACQLDDGPNDIPSKNFTMSNCYMGPASDGSGLLSFGKLVGSHTDSTNGLYTNMKVMGCTSVDSLSNAIQGYSWADATVANNTILGSAERGIRFFFNASNVGPRLVVTGNMISQTVSYGIDINGNTGTFGDVNVSNNVITSSVMNATNNAGISVDTIDRVTICNNSINLEGSSSAKQGINLDTINGGVVSGNGIYSAGTQGIQTTLVKRVGINNNYIYACGREGIWLTAVSDKNMLSGNSIVGAGRTTTNTYGGITISGAANTDNSIVGNKFNKFGDAGNEALTPIVITNNTSVDTFINSNTFGGDWGGPGLGNYTWNNNATVNLGESVFGVYATATTAIGTSITAVTGLSIANIPAGTWKIRAYIPAVTVLSPTAFTITVSPSSGPTVTSGRLVSQCFRSGTSPSSAQSTGASVFNTAMALGALTAVDTVFTVEGSFLSTNTGTVSISMTRTGGTSVTTQIGAYLQVQRQA